MIVIFLHNEENDYQTHLSRIPLACFLDLMHIYRLSLMYLLIFLIPDRASRSRSLRRPCQCEVADDADEVVTREQGAWRLPELRGLETDRTEERHRSIGDKEQ